jgi:phosphotransferase system  glucose/maltose/N-acetylglucosamine-specific IIC component
MVMMMMVVVVVMVMVPKETTLETSPLFCNSFVQSAMCIPPPTNSSGKSYMHMHVCMHACSMYACIRTYFSASIDRQIRSEKKSSARPQWTSRGLM